jgi:hypothetical protein
MYDVLNLHVERVRGPGKFGKLLYGTQYYRIKISRFPFEHSMYYKLSRYNMCSRARNRHIGLISTTTVVKHHLRYINVRQKLCEYSYIAQGE